MSLTTSSTVVINLLIVVEPVNLDLTHIDPLAMADVLKIYFRELPDPIFTFDMYDKFMNLESKSIKRCTIQVVYSLI
jgi:hypothetical protein